MAAVGTRAPGIPGGIPRCALSQPAAAQGVDPLMTLALPLRPGFVIVSCLPQHSQRTTRPGGLSTIPPRGRLLQNQIWSPKRLCAVLWPSAGRECGRQRRLAPRRRVADNVASRRTPSRNIGSTLNWSFSTDVAGWPSAHRDGRNCADLHDGIVGVRGNVPLGRSDRFVPYYRRRRGTSKSPASDGRDRLHVTGRSLPFNGAVLAVGRAARRPTREANPGRPAGAVGAAATGSAAAAGRSSAACDAAA